jgi:hypothetical protein
MNHQCKYELDPKVTAPALSSDDLPSTTTISHAQTKGGNDKKTHHSGQITIKRNKYTYIPNLPNGKYTSNIRKQPCSG